ncbi:unnamed protein product, partial [Staurois parvus]
MGPLCPCPNSKKPMKKGTRGISWGGLTTHGAPRAIGDHGAPLSLSKLKKAYEKGTRGISWGPLLTPGPSGSARVSKWSVRLCDGLPKQSVQWLPTKQDLVLPG